MSLDMFSQQIFMFVRLRYRRGLFPKPLRLVRRSILSLFALRLGLAHRGFNLFLEPSALFSREFAVAVTVGMPSVLNAETPRAEGAAVLEEHVPAVFSPLFIAG